MDNKHLLDMLEDDVYSVYAEETEYIDTNNGMLNETYINNRKKVLLKKSIEYLADEVVTTRQGYPHNDISEVKLSIDLVVMKRDDLDEILRYIRTHE
jgi:hypothetical protein